jgi:hypothetical protein
MAPMIRRYDDLDDTRLEEILRERAFSVGADLWVGRIRDERWRAVFRVYGPTVGRNEEFSDGEAAVGTTKREALIALAQVDDLGTIT